MKALKLSFRISTMFVYVKKIIESESESFRFDIEMD